ncbi:MAG: DUF4416 family protein [Desulfobacterales bacterium]|nr:DUF4416 family protein [Desulfobacterales bacterium]
MSLPQTAKLAKLVIGVFLKEKDLIDLVSRDLKEKFGPPDTISAWLPFNYTSYYEPEMGSPLYRRVMSFQQLIKQCTLPEIKLTTNAIELQYSKAGKRMVNIDPGYLLHERFVLATGKNYTHRIYIGSGIYADLTLIYTKGCFQKLPWTYPDYAAANMLQYLEMVRKKYITDLKPI